MKPLISTSEATELIQSSIVSVESEQVLLEDALDRILAEDITADRDAPPFVSGLCPLGVVEPDLVDHVAGLLRVAHGARTGDPRAHLQVFDGV